MSGAISRTGRVGVGMSSASSEGFEVGGAGRAFFGDGGGSSRKGILIDGVNGSSGNEYGTISYYDYSASTYRNIVIAPTAVGNVGIGTPTPTSKFDVNGSVAFATVNVASNRTIGANDHFIIKTGNGNYAMTLPNPASFPGRVLQFVNGTATGNITFTGFTPIGSITQLNPQSSGDMISNGTSWYWYSSF